MNVNYAPWYAPAGTQRGQLSLFTANRGGGKSMLTQKLLLDMLRNQVTTTGSTVITATQSPIMTSTSNSITFDFESGIEPSLFERLRRGLNHKMETDDSYFEDFEQYILRAKRIFDCRSCIRKPIQGESLHGEAGLESIRVRSTDTIFYYRKEIDDDDGSEYFDVAFLKIGDVVFPLHTDQADYNETDIFRNHFTPGFEHLDNLPFHRVMEEIIEFYEDYATDYGIQHGTN